MSVELKEIQMKEIELLEMMGITQPCLLMERKRKMLRKTKTLGMCEQKRGTGQSGHFELLAWRRRKGKG